ncbi:unnamed protein product [Mytilus edulis]|uniref:YqaJ viral recombinase domain-containing protein n=1 Tax=Mytilus edulis TaxID=6550 RepID=A0A8S3QHB0_MYTED|nr:unnamed protein product [Mytilus edulis]
MKRKHRNYNNRKYRWKKSKANSSDVQPDFTVLEDDDNEEDHNDDEDNTDANDLDDINDDDDDDDDEDDDDYDDDDKWILKLQKMLPDVVHAFRKNNLIIYLLMLFTLISTAKFDFKNICFLLFCDILRYWSTDSTSKMRYPFKETQQFWWLGKILFHGRFQRFMSGYKHAGQSNLTGYLNPATARINFALPSHIHINEHPIDLKIPDIKGPGIFHEMIQLISSQKKNSYVLTFDGKKLAPGLTDEAGDIDLLGYGPEPLHQQHEQYTKSKEIISKITGYLQGSSKSDNYIKNALLDVSHRVSKSIRDLRQLIAKQQYALDKFTTKAASEPGKNYCYVIDSIKTAIYRAKSTIKDALATNDALFGFIALLQNSSGYCTDKMVNLSKTKSFVTLKEPRQVHSSLRLPETEHVPHHLLKQKSDEWFNLRKTVKVTGSTAYNALGIDGLKSQKETFQYINNQKEKPAPTEQQQMAMKHGTENEIHALATLHSKVMPAFFPNLTYYEEGIHMITANNKNIIGVSPDGSIRRSENLSGVIEDIVYAVECKCPYSSYKFNTPVYYKIPTRYICQTMLEMRSMGCQECIFLCWTEESTTVFKLRLNQRLIALIINESVDVFYSENDKPPSKLSSRAKEIKELCKDISNSSTFIGEFPSVLGTLHTNELIIDQDNLPYQTFQTTTPTLKKDYCEKEMISTLVSASTVLKEAYQLNRKKASEVIPIMLSTVDRISNPETGHAQPIGYFLRGYSLSTDVMRNIAEDFMQACFVNGIHVPVQTFDGQWINLVVRDQQGNPQTKLQLQVDVWKEVKRMPKKILSEK